MSQNRWVPSRFNAQAHTEDGELILYNSYTGAIATIPEKDNVLPVLRKEGFMGDLPDHLRPLVECGFLVSDQVNEDIRARFLHQSLHRTDAMHLVIMPTEACNFRCNYCYQTFPHGTMRQDIRDGLKQYIANHSRFLQHLTISWFGGEPMLAFDVIRELSESILQSMDHYGVTYTADMATNGYDLTAEKFRSLLNWNVRSYMITLDGSPEVHDSRRCLTGGGKTFKKIVENLKEIKSIDEEYEIYIRVNFDEHNLHDIPAFLAYLGKLFEGDARFQIFCRPVGRWGGANDGDLPICDHRVAENKIWEFTEQGLREGIQMSSILESMLKPAGAVCYSAKPNSLVIGADGQLYKCSCSFQEEYNRIGALMPDGKTELDYDKLALWVTSGEDTDEGCQACFFRPACQGNHCPLYRMRTGKRPCPFEKRKIKRMLNLIWRQDTKIGR